MGAVRGCNGGGGACRPVFFFFFFLQQRSHRLHGAGGGMACSPVTAAWKLVTLASPLTFAKACISGSSKLVTRMWCARYDNVCIFSSNFRFVSDSFLRVEARLITSDAFFLRWHRMDARESQSRSRPV